MATNAPIPEREGITRATPALSSATAAPSGRPDRQRFEWSAQDPMAYRRLLAAAPRGVTR